MPVPVRYKLATARQGVIVKNEEQVHQLPIDRPLDLAQAFRCALAPPSIVGDRTLC